MFDILIKYFTIPKLIAFHVIMILGLTIGLFRFKKLSYISRLAFTLLLLTIIVEGIAYYCAVVFKNNAFVYNPFTIVQCFLLSFVFYSESKNVVIPVMLVVFLIFAIVNGVISEPFLKKANHRTHLLESLLIIIWYFLFLIAYFKRDNKFNLSNFPLFWLGTGWMIFSITSIFSFGFNLLVTNESGWYNWLTSAKVITNYILYASFIPAFLCPQKSLNDFTTSSK